MLELAVEDEELQMQRGDGRMAVGSCSTHGVAKDGERKEIETAPDSEVVALRLDLEIWVWLPFRLRLKPTEARVKLASALARIPLEGKVRTSTERGAAPHWTVTSTARELQNTVDQA
ncbi:hypothetical protein NM208_g9763 [Fusarium decemcellulare]|uniref:Uncharacterized protein n=1 Tax=Fusarium decemcellulare TaxID=57161 RepID=A0ACC1S0C1_9HYPO|nr:hypothetical protein NM208_g9763 [Fusarium decemcellulare]